MATAELSAATRGADQQGMSLTDVLAHHEASHVTWRGREIFLRGLALNGRIATAGDQMLAEQAGHWAHVEVTIEYVSPVSPAGDVYLIIASPYGTGRALAVVDAAQHAEAHDWMLQDSASLFGRAIELFGQPGIDLRRSAFEAVA